MKNEPGSEVPLTGGSVNVVVRVGDTVRRSTGPWTPAVHALLRHLKAVGFGGAPRVLGIDEAGREILTFIKGTPANRPWPAELRTDAGLRALAPLLRRYHDAVASFTPLDGAEWRIGRVPLLPGQIVRHGDVGPWNTIWRDGMPVALIDWDLAEPGSPLLDVAQATWLSTPLSGERVWKKAGFTSPPDARARLHAFCAGYGRYSPAEVVDAVEQVQAMDRSRTLTLGASGVEPWASFLAHDVVETIDGEMAWLRENRARLV